MPDSLEYDSGKQRLHVGSGYVENVPPAVWSYEISGKHVLVQWFSYRRKNRERPIIGDRRQPSPLGDIQPDHWLPEYTSELINVLNVLGLLVELEPQQAELLNKISAGPLISNAELEAAGAFTLPPKTKKTKKKSGTIHMFEAETHDELEAGEVKP
jgi:Type ISP C-terminal specificity domain